MPNEKRKRKRKHDDVLDYEFMPRKGDYSFFSELKNVSRYYLGGICRMAPVEEGISSHHQFHESGENLPPIIARRKKQSELARYIDLVSATHDLNSIIFFTQERDALDGQNFVSQSLRRTLKRRRKEENFHISPVIDFQQTLRTLFSGAFEHMKLLVRYGVVHNTPGYLEDWVLRMLLTLLMRVLTKDRYEVKDFLRVSYIRCRKKENPKRQEMIQKWINQKRDVICVLLLILLKERNEATEESNIQREAWKRFELDGTITYQKVDRIECLKLYFQTSPEPYPTLNEFKKFVNTLRMEFAGLVMDPNELEYFNDLIEYFKLHLPEYNGEYKPRSLLHLSRCQVRINLRKSGVLPYVVNEMNLPYILKTLILADSEDFRIQ